MWRFDNFLSFAEQNLPCVIYAESRAQKRGKHIIISMLCNGKGIFVCSITKSFPSRLDTLHARKTLSSYCLHFRQSFRFSSSFLDTLLLCSLFAALPTVAFGGAKHNAK